MRAGLLVVSTVMVVACAGSEPRRRGPPGGGVDPATITADDLSMDPPAARRKDAHASSPAPASKTTGASAPKGTGLEDLMPRMDAPGAAPAPQPAPAGEQPSSSSSPASGGSFKITAAHCNEVGRKFSQLTIDGGGSRAQAEKVGADVAAKCTRDQVGQEVTRREYDCILAAKTMLDVATCK